jgi:hypothetical protein
VSKITETQFKNLCDDIYRDRRQIYSYNPNMSRRECLEWMILCSLMPLLNVTEEPSASTYSQAICEVLENRTTEPFDVMKYLENLSEKIEKGNVEL